MYFPGKVEMGFCVNYIPTQTQICSHFPDHINKAKRIEHELKDFSHMRGSSSSIAPNMKSVVSKINNYVSS